MLGLYPVWNCYPKGSHTTEATKPSIIANDEIEDKICKEYVSEYDLVLLRRFPLLEIFLQESILKTLI